MGPDRDRPPGIVLSPTCSARRGQPDVVSPTWSARRRIRRADRLPRLPPPTPRSTLSPAAIGLTARRSTLSPAAIGLTARVFTTPAWGQTGTPPAAGRARRPRTPPPPRRSTSSLGRDWAHCPCVHYPGAGSDGQTAGRRRRPRPQTAGVGVSRSGRRVDRAGSARVDRVRDRRRQHRVLLRKARRAALCC